MLLTIHPITESHARAASAWRYPAPYALYDHEPDNWQRFLVPPTGTTLSSPPSSTSAAPIRDTGFPAMSSNADETGEFESKSRSARGAGKA